MIRLSLRLVDRSMIHQKIDATLVRYVDSILSVALQVALIVAILGFFGVETTTFAALIAAAGVAIGMAWSGLLANFAAGAFLVVLRPFKVGDVVSAGGVTGKVREIGLFVTTISPTPCRTSPPTRTGASTSWRSSRARPIIGLRSSS